MNLKGGRIVTEALITLQAGCAIVADTLSTSFIDGPLKKDGLLNQSFLFPVGKLNTLRWIYLTNATGSFTVEYFKSDPHVVSGLNGTGIHHFSEVEYWDVTAGGTASANVRLSFASPHSGGITDLSSLRVARLINGTWEDAGNAGVSGTPGSDGWVSSNAAGGFSANTKSFALASAIGPENPLPISSVLLHAVQKDEWIVFSWKIDPDMKAERFELQRSYDGISYTCVYVANRVGGKHEFSIHQPAEKMRAYYRVIARNGNSQNYLSNVLRLENNQPRSWLVAGSNIVSDNLRLQINVNERRTMLFIIFDINGKLAGSYQRKKGEPSSFINLNVSGLLRGVYFIKELSGNYDQNITRFIKL